VRKLGLVFGTGFGRSHQIIAFLFNSSFILTRDSQSLREIVARKGVGKAERDNAEQSDDALAESSKWTIFHLPRAHASTINRHNSEKEGGMSESRGNVAW
jgi:hypothetical protein